MLTTEAHADITPPRPPQPLSARERAILEEASLPPEAPPIAPIVAASAGLLLLAVLLWRRLTRPTHP